jgi:hypothetical protein
MMHPRHSKLILLLIIVLFGFSNASSQQAGANAVKADDALRQQAFDLLDSVAGQISILQSPENRARVASNVAASIWEHDERKARALLVSVQEDINAGLRIQEGDQQADRQRRMVFLQLRVNTVERIAKYDGELALAFFRNTAAPLPETKADDERRDYNEHQERALELSLARQMAEKSPEVALDLGRQSLAKELSYELIGLLLQLNRKHPEQAQTLFTEIVDKLKHANLQSEPNGFYFSVNLIRSFAPFAKSNASFRELTNMFTSAAETYGCNRKSEENDMRGYFCDQIAQVLRLVDKPGGRSARQQQSEESDDSESYAFGQELNEVAENGSIDDILALGKKYPQIQDGVYWRAFIKAETTGDIDRARKIVEEMPAEVPSRSYMLQTLERQEKLGAKFRESLKDIDKALDEMKSMEEKIDFLLAAAGKISQTDQKEAIKLLNRANGLADTMKPGSDQLAMQMVLAIAYSVYKSSRGIVMIESLMPKLNELVGAAAKLDGYETHHLRDGEWNMSAEGQLGTLFTGLAQSAPYFAWCDFDRAASVAGQFERPELRLMAQVKLAQGILAGRPKPQANAPIPWPREN